MVHFAPRICLSVVGWVGAREARRRVTYRCTAGRAALARLWYSVQPLPAAMGCSLGLCLCLVSSVSLTQSQHLLGLLQILGQVSGETEKEKSLPSRK